LLVTAALLLAVQRATGWDALGNVTTGILASVACVAARPLVLLGSRSLTPLWARLFGPSGTFAARHVGQQARRVALATATLGIGLGTILMFGMLAWSFEETLVGVLEARMRADLVVHSAFAGSGYVGAPLDEALLDDLEALPGVALLAGERQRDVHYRDGDVVLDAYDPPCFADARVCEWVLDAGELPEARRLVEHGEAVLVSSSFARAHGARPGDTIALSTPHGPLRTKVAGVTNGQPASAIILSRTLYRERWNDTLLSWVHVAVADPGQVTSVQQEVERRLGERYRLRVRSSASLIEYFAGQARQAFQFVYIMEAIIFMIVLVAIGDTLSTSVLERTRVFGMMRAVGLPRSGLFTIVLLEGVAIGVLGLILALGMGIALGTFWVEVQFPALLGWTLDLYFPYAFVFGAAALTLALCVAASVLPSLRAARLVVTAALRAE
jgi:putative ABC transport system permease protein